LKIRRSWETSTKLNEIRVLLKEKDDFFDGWLKHLPDLDFLGVNEYDIRYVGHLEDVYYCIDDIVKYLTENGWSKGLLIEKIKELCPGISGDSIKDIRKALDQ
jgi:hypothetical protein